MTIKGLDSGIRRNDDRVFVRWHDDLICGEFVVKHLDFRNELICACFMMGDYKVLFRGKLVDYATRRFFLDFGCGGPKTVSSFKGS